ncbi:MAG: NUDIX domain-containing protein [Bacteroidota bacterium]
MMENVSGINPHVSVDCVIFGFDGESLKLLVIEREVGEGVSKRVNALPGDLIKDDEDLNSAAARILYELTNLADIYLEQFFTFGNPLRIRNPEDVEWLRRVRAFPNARVITVAYYSLVRLDKLAPRASSFAKMAGWSPIDDKLKLAFDHNEIVNKALETLRYKLKFQPVGFELLPKKFTLSQLQKLYEAIFGLALDKRNFRKKFLNKKILIPLQEKEIGVAHKPARYYQFDESRYREISGKEILFNI